MDELINLEVEHKSHANFPSIATGGAAASWQHSRHNLEPTLGARQALDRRRKLNYIHVSQRGI